MVEVVTFGHPYADITSIRTTLTKEDSVSVAESNGYDTMTGFFGAQAVEVGHNLFFEFITIRRINNTINHSAIWQSVFVATLEIQIQVTFTLHNSFSLSPINAIRIALFVLSSNKVTHLFHERSNNTIKVDQEWNFMSRCNLSMVREDENSPTFIEEMKEFTEIVVSLLIEVSHPLFCNFYRLFVKWTFCQMLNEHMFFKVNGMEVREDNIKIFTFDQMMQSSRLPISSCVPAGQHAVGNQHGILATNHGSRGWIANVFSDFLKQFLWMPYTVICCVHTGRYIHGYIVTIFAKFQHLEVTVNFFVLLIILNGFVKYFDNHFTKWADTHWFGVLFALIDSNSVINASFIILQNQAWATNQTARKK